ncbi:MAG: hypothetical protein ACKVQR_08465 [Aquabacterium sp.]
MVDARHPPDTDAPLAPGQQADAPFFAPSTRRLALRALMLWLALATLLAGLQWLTTEALPDPLTLARRMGQLLQESWLFLVLPPLVITPLAGLAPRLLKRMPEFTSPPWAMAREVGCNLGLFAFMGMGLAWAGVGIAYAVDGTDPWDHMPGVTPPYLEGFVARHPQLRVEKINGVYEVNLTHRQTGGWLRLDGRALADADVRMERCIPPGPTQDFGGLPLHPKAECRRVLTLQRPGAPARLVIAFVTPTELSFAELRRFYEEWAKAGGLEARFSGGPTRWDFVVERGGQRLHLHVPNGRTPGPSIILEQGGRRPPVQADVIDTDAASEPASVEPEEDAASTPGR